MVQTEAETMGHAYQTKEEQQEKRRKEEEEQRQYRADMKKYELDKAKYNRDMRDKEKEADKKHEEKRRDQKQELREKEKRDQVDKKEKKKAKKDPDGGYISAAATAAKNGPKDLANQAKKVASKIAEVGKQIQDSVMKPTLPKKPVKPIRVKSPRPRRPTPAPRPRNPPRPRVPPRPKAAVVMEEQKRKKHKEKVLGIPAIETRERDRPHTQHATPEGTEMELKELAEM